MTELTIATLDGGRRTIDAATVTALAGGLRGSVCAPGEDGYDTARTIWNAMIDRRPGAVVRCLGAADVMQAVRFAAEHDLLMAVRGGGHNIAGNAVCDGGFLVAQDGAIDERNV